MQTNSVSTCLQCGGRLIYKPSTTLLVCEQCLSEFAFDIKSPNVSFLDYNTHKSLSEFVFENVNTVQCSSCGAEINFYEEISNTCPFCSSSLKNEKIIEKQEIQALGIIPFQISQKKAVENYIHWIKKMRFAPNNLKKSYNLLKFFKGIYIPYYLLNYKATVEYSGKESGKYGNRYSGKMEIEINNIALLASNSIPHQFKDKINNPLNLIKLEPWDNQWNFKNLVGFQNEFIQGYNIEVPKIQLDIRLKELKTLKDSTSTTKLDDFVSEELNKKIKKKSYKTTMSTVFKDENLTVSEQEQIIDESISNDNDDDDISFSKLTYTNEKIHYSLVLLPVWINVYRYKNKVYKFLVNGTTGQVVGDRPYSKIKLTIAWILSILIMLSIVFALSQEFYEILFLYFGLAILFIYVDEKRKKNANR